MSSQPATQQGSRPASPFIEADVAAVEAKAPTTNGARQDRPLRGILLVITSTVFLCSSDTMAKYLTARLPAIEISWLRYFTYMLIMCPLVLAAPRRALQTARPGLQVVRGLTLIGSSLLFVFALRFLPIAEATTTSFVSPIFITVRSIIFLNESVGLRRWLATIAGLLGVIIVVRPGTSAFQPASLFALGSAMCWAFSLVITRRIAGRDGAVTTMTYSAIAGFALLCVLLPFVWTMPSPTDLVIGACIGIAATSGHWLVVLAYRYGDASVLAPFSYTQPIWAVVLGYLVFSEVPDSWTFAGAAIIIASGLYTAHRERVRQSMRPRVSEITAEA